jgi:tRNA pseudouridine55 synthase
VKIDGRRAYQLARRGDAVATALRTVEVVGLSIDRYKYPELELIIKCSSGTYVRSLGRDLAASLGTRAVMSTLVRTAVGEFRLEEALDAKRINAESLREHLLSPLTAISRLPHIILSNEQVAQVKRGGLFTIEELFGPGEWPGDAVAAVDDSGALVAILKEARPGLLKPSPNFLQMA